MFLIEKLNTKERWIIWNTILVVAMHALNESYPNNIISIYFSKHFGNQTIVGGLIKALPAITLAFTSFQAFVDSKAVYLLMFAIALVFCSLGDFFLYLEKDRVHYSEMYFIYGLGAFLISHAIFAICFYMRLKRLQNICKTHCPATMSFDIVPYLVFVYAIIFFNIMSVNLSKDENLKYAVGIYCFVIGMMFFMALWNHRLEKRVRHTIDDEPKKMKHLMGLLPRWRAPGYLIGSVLFIISDSFIGYGRFVETDEDVQYNIQILSTYFIAITFLCISSISEPILNGDTEATIEKMMC